ncbi:hypothetical protein BAE44_0004641 [Dichanthelium oligosanthes]|uniref:Uncharacterized protein n=1 Tax=Dichanthelium oligosanthes TaxID=888268 RepID=A0A1E5WAC9_9POAL|nr:hypothetical protein BAE44_0004641 [Dichanthelium oligosanthes]
MDVEGKGLQETLANANFLGTYALHAVCNSGNMSALHYLVEDLNIDINKPDTMRGFMPAMHAVLYGNLPASRFLLDHGANLHQQHNGISLLHASAEGGRPEITKFLLSRGARADVESTSFTPLAPTSFTPLFIATYRGYASILKILLEQKQDPNVCMSDKITPLSMALRHSSVSCLKLLVQAGADVNGCESYNPLARAAEKGLTEAIKCLLEAGANPNVPDTALKVDQFDATLFSNRSICWLRLGDGNKASYDAIECKDLRPKSAKAYYRKGAALMFLKDYDSAYDAFSRGLELDPESDEMEKLLWEAMELK